MGKRSKRRSENLQSSGPSTWCGKSKLYHLLQLAAQAEAKSDFKPGSFKTAAIAAMIQATERSLPHHLYAVQPTNKNKKEVEAMLRWEESDKRAKGKSCANCPVKCTLLNSDIHGHTALDLAIACGNVDALEFMLDNGANPNVAYGNDRHQYHSHPLHTAIAYSRAECLPALLSAGASIAKGYQCDVGECSDSVLFHAISKIDGSIFTQKALQTLKVLLDSKEGKDNLNMLTKKGTTAVYECVKWCQSRSSCDNCKSHSRDVKCKALVEALKMLIEAGADLTLTRTSKKQQDLLQAACHTDANPEIIDVLLTDGQMDPNFRSLFCGLNSLEAAMEIGHLEGVKKLLSHEAVDVNSTAMDGNRAVMQAVLCKDDDSLEDRKKCIEELSKHPAFRLTKLEEEIIKDKMGLSFASKEDEMYSYAEDSIVEAMDNLNVSDDKGNKKKKDPALLRAVESGDVELVQEELDSGTDINVSNKFGEGVVHKAVAINDLDMLKLLIAKGADVNIENIKGESPLHYAARKSNSLEVMDELLENGADVEAKCEKGLTPLFLATYSNRLENVEYLCAERGASVYNARHESTGANCLHVASQVNNGCILEVLLREKFENSSGLSTTGFSFSNRFEASLMHYAAASDADETAEMVLDVLGKDLIVDLVRSLEGDAPLHVAAACGSLKVAKILLSNGAAVDGRNKLQESPLFLAAVKGHLQMMELLLDSGADVESRNKHGQTPLFASIVFREFDAAKMLIAKGADVNAKETHMDETPLHLAAMVGNSEFVQHLVESGADLTARDRNGCQPLHRAARASGDKMVTTLISLGADNQSTLPTGETVLDIIAERTNIMRLDDLVVKDSNGKMALKLPLDQLERKMLDLGKRFGSVR